MKKVLLFIIGIAICWAGLEYMHRQGGLASRTAICTCGSKIIAESSYPIGTYGECTKCRKVW